MSDTTERPDSPSDETAAPDPPAAPPSGGQPEAPSTEGAAPAAESAAPAGEVPGAAAPALAPGPPAPAAPAPPTAPATTAAAPAPAVPAPAAPAAAGPPPAPAAAGAAPPPSSFLERVKRVFNFETSVYSEVAGDGLATLEAIMVVVLSSLLAGGFWNLTLIFFFTVPFALLITAVSAVLVSVAARLFNPDSPGFAPWFRALGFAQAPLALGLIPLLGSLVGLVYWIATSIAAIHRVARIPVGQAILTWVLALMLPLLFLLFLVLLFGGLAVLGTLAGSRV